MSLSLHTRWILGALSLTALLSAAALPTSTLPQEDAKPTLASLEWMAGHWRSETERGFTEELWMPPRGGVMLGLNRSGRGKQGRAQFEYLRIEEGKQGVVYLASPGGGQPTPFRLVEADERHAVFENPEHDFPKRIEYRRDGDKLVAAIAGDEPGPSWTLKRVGKVE